MASLAVEFSPEETGDELARRTQIRCAHIGLEDREQRGRVGEQQALTAIEPQQIRVPVFGLRSRSRLREELRADGGEELLRAPQDHLPIVRAALPGDSGDSHGAPARRSPRSGATRTARLTTGLPLITAVMAVAGIARLWGELAGEAHYGGGPGRRTTPGSPPAACAARYRWRC